MKHVYVTSLRRRRYLLLAAALALASAVAATLVGAVSGGTSAKLAAQSLPQRTVARASVRTMGNIPASTR